LRTCLDLHARREKRVTVLTPVSLALHISDKKRCLKRALMLLLMLRDGHCRERFEVRVALFAALMSSRERMSKTHCSGDGE
jgi:hypothetical protein